MECRVPCGLEGRDVYAGTEGRMEAGIYNAGRTRVPREESTVGRDMVL